MNKNIIFIEKSKKIHFEKYDYDDVEYIDSRLKVKIFCNTCKKHFYQTPKAHLSGKGCKNCANKNMTYTKETFIKNAKEIHNNKYNYDEICYTNARTKVKIFCNTCKKYFYQTPNLHLSGKGCKKCSIINRRKDVDEFIKECKKIHNNKYNYRLVNYINNKSKIKIICPIHDVFEQVAGSHLKGCGCKKCDIIKRRIEENKNNGYQLVPAYNKDGCEIFDNIMKEKNIHIQHAMNGGEYYIKELGYWLDGYDKENNIVYEFDESHHFIKGLLKEKDITRQQEIEKYLKCEFIRIKK